MTTHSGDTLGERLAHHAAAQPDRRVFSFLRDGNAVGAITYAELDARARRVAGELVAATARLVDRTALPFGSADGRGQAPAVDREQPRALLLLPQSLAFVDALFGCFYAGVCGVPAHAPTAAQSGNAVARLRSIAADARPHLVLTVRNQLALRDAVPELAAATWIAVDDLATSATPACGPRARGDDLAILQYSSGSTGDPRGVMVSHANLMHNEALIEEAFEHSPASIVLGWLPFQHDMGLIGNVLQPVYAGAECILMTTTAFLKQPLRWLQEISRHRATTSGAPNFAYEACVRHAERSDCSDLDLSSWSLAFVGAEPVRAGTLERFAATFARYGFRREALYPCYGLAEATLMVTGGVRAEPFAATQLERAGGGASPLRVSCGPARLGQQLAIVDPASRHRLPHGEGEIWVRGPGVARGYFGRPEASRTTFEARIDGEHGDWLRTGDLGQLVDGELYVTGRIKDIAVVKGVKHVAEDIEHTVESACTTALRAGACAVFSFDDGERELLAVIQETDRGSVAPWSELAARIATAVFHEHGVHADVVALVRPGTIPRTTSGKMRRGACRDLFTQGALAEVHRHTMPTTRHTRAAGS